MSNNDFNMEELVHADESTSGSDQASQRPGSSGNWGPLPWSSSTQVPSFPSTSTGWQGALGSAPSLANPFSSSLLCAVPRAGLLMPPQVQVSGASPAVLNEEVLAPEDGQPGRVQGEVGHGGSGSAASSAAPDDQSGLQVLLERVLANQQREMADQMASLKQEVRSMFQELKASQVAELDGQKSTGESIFLLKLTNLPIPI